MRTHKWSVKYKVKTHDYIWFTQYKAFESSVVFFLLLLLKASVTNHIKSTLWEQSDDHIKRVSIKYKMTVFVSFVLLHFMKSSDVITDFLTVGCVLYFQAHLSLSDCMGHHFSTACLQTLIGQRLKSQLVTVIRCGLLKTVIFYSTESHWEVSYFMLQVKLVHSLASDVLLAPSPGDRWGLTQFVLCEN